MKIYVSHPRTFDYKIELYEPLKKSNINADFIFPHDTSEEPYDSKKLFIEKGCDLVLAEGSYQSTGQGIELGWADSNNIKIVCIYKIGAIVSSSLKTIASDLIEYNSIEDLTNKLTNALK